MGVLGPEVWADVLREQLSESKAVVSVLTPRSLEKPWVLFESGFGAANPDCDVIPVCVGMPQSDIPFPLAMYQTFQLSDYNSLNKFVSKLLKKLDIAFDEVMSRSILEETVALMQDINVGEKDTIKASLNVNEAIDDVKSHIDRRLLSLIRSQGVLVTKDDENGDSLYSVNVFIEFPTLKKKLDIEIMAETIMAEVLNGIYVSLGDLVEPYTYLMSWILREQNKNINIFISEGASRIPATTLIAPGSSWVVLPLEAPVLAID